MDSLGNAATEAIGTAKKQFEMTPEQLKRFEGDCKRYDIEVAAAKAELFKLTSVMPSPGTEQDPATRAALFWDILKTELSPANISAVCRSGMRGDVTGGKWLPSPAELISYGRTWFQRRYPVRGDPRLAGPRREPLRLSAPEHRLLTERDEIPADELARVSTQFRNLADRMKAQVDFEQQSVRPKPVPIDHSAPIAIGPSLREKLDDIARRERIAADEAAE